ncbi:MAG: MFS transporter [Gammaproteobacteria bacterium]
MSDTLQPKHKRIALFALCLAFFMVIIDVTIVNVALPSMSIELHGGISWLQWIIDGYALTFACFLLSAGHFGDHFGPKVSFVLGLILFTLTSLGCGLANDFLTLTGFRLLQGMAAALMVPTSLSLVNVLFKTKTERARAIGIWGSIGGIAAACGPLVGGILTSIFSWRSVFFVNVPVGLLAIIIAVIYVPRPGGTGKESFDVPGQFFAICSIGALAFGLIESGRLGWTSPLVQYSFILFAIALVVFLFLEWRVKSPMFPLTLFKSREFSIGLISGVLLNFAFFGILFLLPLYFQHVRHYSVLMTGMAVLPLTVLTIFGSFFSGRVTGKYGSKLPMIIGLSFVTFGFVGALIAAEDHPTYLALALPLLAVGFGIAFAMPAATVMIMNAVPPTHTGLASGTFNALRQVGSLIGVAVFGTVVAVSSGFVEGLHVGLICSAIACFIALCFVLFLPGGITPDEK